MFCLKNLMNRTEIWKKKLCMEDMREMRAEKIKTVGFVVEVASRMHPRWWKGGRGSCASRRSFLQHCD